MLHILLLILKIIGIILLVLLGLLVLCVNSVLFVPFRYRAKGEVSGTIESLNAEAKISWFFHLIYGYVIYKEKKLDWQLRILWKKWGPDKSQDTFKPQKDIQSTVKKKDKPDENLENDLNISMPIDSRPEAEKIHKVKKPNVFEKIKCTFKMICDKMKMLMKQKEQLQEFLSNEIHKSAWKKLLQEIFRLLRFIKPKKLYLRLRFGFEDPAMTGNALAILSMLYPFYVDTVHIEPDFHEKVLEGDGFMKGNIRSLHLLIVCWNLFFDKNVKQAYKAIQNWER